MFEAGDPEGRSWTAMSRWFDREAVIATMSAPQGTMTLPEELRDSDPATARFQADSFGGASGHVVRGLGLPRLLS